MTSEQNLIRHTYLHSQRTFEAMDLSSITLHLAGNKFDQIKTSSLGTLILRSPPSIHKCGSLLICSGNSGQENQKWLGVRCADKESSRYRGAFRLVLSSDVMNLRLKFRPALIRHQIEREGEREREREREKACECGSRIRH